MTFSSNQSYESDAPWDDNGSDESQLAPQESQLPRARWYAVQVASGCEKRVKANIDQRKETLDVADRILQIAIPQTPAVKVRKDGARQNIEEKVFPGYVLIQMRMDDEVWQVVKNTPHVINFVGAEQKRRYGRGRGHVKPMPLSPSEVERIFKQTGEQEPVVKIDMDAGDKIVVLSGPLKTLKAKSLKLAPNAANSKPCCLSLGAIPL